jgi:hypothetical protein
MLHLERFPDDTVKITLDTPDLETQVWQELIHPGDRAVFPSEIFGYLTYPRAGLRCILFSATS